MQGELSIGTAVAQIMPGCNQQEDFKKKKMACSFVAFVFKCQPVS